MFYRIKSCYVASCVCTVFVRLYYLYLCTIPVFVRTNGVLVLYLYSMYEVYMYSTSIKRILTSIFGVIFIMPKKIPFGLLKPILTSDSDSPQKTESDTYCQQQMEELISIIFVARKNGF